MCERFDIDQSRDIDRVDDIMESIINEAFAKSMFIDFGQH